MDTDWRWTFEGGAYKDIGPVTEVGSVTTYPMREYSSEDPGWTHYLDRKSTRLNSSHTVISYAVFCWKKKNKKKKKKKKIKKNRK